MTVFHTSDLDVSDLGSLSMTVDLSSEGVDEFGDRIDYSAAADEYDAWRTCAEREHLVDDLIARAADEDPSKMEYLGRKVRNALHARAFSQGGSVSARDVLDSRAVIRRSLPNSSVEVADRLFETDALTKLISNISDESLEAAVTLVDAFPDVVLDLEDESDELIHEALAAEDELMSAIRRRRFDEAESFVRHAKFGKNISRRFSNRQIAKMRAAATSGKRARTVAHRNFHLVTKAGWTFKVNSEGIIVDARRLTSGR